MDFQTNGGPFLGVKYSELHSDLTLNIYSNSNGSMAGDVGFDPLGLAKSPKILRIFREGMIRVL